MTSVSWRECPVCQKRSIREAACCSSECDTIYQSSLDSLADMGRELDLAALEEHEHQMTCPYCVNSDLPGPERRARCRRLTAERAEKVEKVNR